MPEHTDAAPGPQSKAEQLLSKRGNAQDKTPGVSELSAAIRGVGYALLAIREELAALRAAALRADAQQRAGPARR